MTDFHVVSYELYAIGGHSHLMYYNFIVSNNTDARIREVETKVAPGMLYDNGQTFKRYATFVFFKHVKQQRRLKENLSLTLISKESLELEL
jgi:hypothetical protein